MFGGLSGSAKFHESLPCKGARRQPTGTDAVIASPPARNFAVCSGRSGASGAMPGSGCTTYSLTG